MTFDECGGKVKDIKSLPKAQALFKVASNNFNAHVSQKN
jgi:hypothetical protein